MNTKEVIGSFFGKGIENYLGHFEPEGGVFYALLWGDIIIYFAIHAGAIFLLWHIYKWIVSKTDLNTKQSSKTEAQTNVLKGTPVTLEGSGQSTGVRVTSGKRSSGFS